MNIPSFIKYQFVDEKTGYLTAPIQQIMDILFQQLQENVSNDGFVIPSLTTNQITYIASPTNANRKPSGTIWYDSDTNELKANINGVVKVINTI